MRAISISEKWALHLVDGNENNVKENGKTVGLDDVTFQLRNAETGEAIGFDSETPIPMLGEILTEVYCRRDAIVELLNTLVNISGGYNIKVTDKLFIVDNDVIIKIHTDNKEDKLMNVKNDFESAAYLMKISYTYEPNMIAGTLLKEIMNQMFMSYIAEKSIKKSVEGKRISIQIMLMNEDDISGAIDVLDNLRGSFNGYEGERRELTFKEVMQALREDDEDDTEDEETHKCVGCGACRTCGGCTYDDEDDIEDDIEDEEDIEFSSMDDMEDIEDMDGMDGMDDMEDMDDEDEGTLIIELEHILPDIFDESAEDEEYEDGIEYEEDIEDDIEDEEDEEDIEDEEDNTVDFDEEAEKELEEFIKYIGINTSESNVDEVFTADVNNEDDFEGDEYSEQESEDDFSETLGEIEFNQKDTDKDIDKINDANEHQIYFEKWAEENGIDADNIRDGLSEICDGLQEEQEAKNREYDNMQAFEEDMADIMDELYDNRDDEEDDIEYKPEADKEMIDLYGSEESTLITVLENDRKKRNRKKNNGGN